MELWELVARERIRDTVATYNWSGDALRLDGVAAAFCADGQLEVRGRPPLRGVATPSWRSSGAWPTTPTPPRATPPPEVDPPRPAGAGSSATT
jgi:hypothetical protein